MKFVIPPNTNLGAAFASALTIAQMTNGQRALASTFNFANAAHKYDGIRRLSSTAAVTNSVSFSINWPPIPPP